MNKKCQKCGAELPVFPGTCPRCGAVNGDSLSSNAGPTYNRPGESVLLSYPLAKPWPRFFARTFDIWLEYAIVFALLFLYVFFISPDILNSFSRHSILFGAVLFPMVFIIDTAIQAIFGNTLGKSMLGLKVGDMHGNKLGLLKYLKRNGYVWLMGYWLGFPALGGPMIHQWLRMKKGKQASYDEIMGTRVWAKPIGLIRKSVFSCLLLSLLGLVFIGIAKNANDQNAYAANNAITYPWTNPLTDKQIKVTKNWKVYTKTNREGETYWKFVNSSDRSFEVLGVEAIPGITIGKYAGSYMDLLSHNVKFDSGGYIQKDHGIRAWKGRGHVIGKKIVSVQLVIAQQDDKFWRIVIFRTMPKDQVWLDSTSLENKLLSTIY